MPSHADFDLDVQQFISRWPCAAQIFLRYGMACVGCEMGRFETVREAAEIYGYPFEEFKAEIVEACRLGAKG